MNECIDCPRCDEGDERSEGLNVCGLCECRFYVKDGKIVRVGDQPILSERDIVELVGGKWPR